jgi:ribosomal protein S18 acetylase RimI-like enzyme
MTEIRGPINPIAESWGFLLHGLTQPVFMSPHNPLYYNKLAIEAGYEKAKDLVVYEADGGNGYVIPDRFTRFAENRLKRKPEFSVRTINKRNLQIEAGHILRILNEAVAGNWGYVPVEEDEMVEVVNKLKLILDEDAIWFVEYKGFPVGVALGYPDINIIFKKIKGRLSPSGLYHLLMDRKLIKDYRLWGLAILPEYHGMGLDVLLYVNLYRALEPKGIRLEANYMLEDNSKILNALKKMELKQMKKYRVYEKRIN